VQTRVKRAFAEHFDEEIQFFKSWISKPKAVGAVLPTSSITARRMASVINPENNAKVLELGPGTGVISKAILERGIRPENLYSVEYTKSFIPKLKANYPGVNFIHGDAFDLDRALPDLGDEKFDSVISAIPLLNFPVKQRIELIKSLLELTEPGRPIIQFSYGPISPVPPDWETYSVEPYDWVLRNVPPARLWVFRKIKTA